jgi:hypothetical protein
MMDWTTIIVIFNQCITLYLLYKTYRNLQTEKKDHEKTKDKLKPLHKLTYLLQKGWVYMPDDSNSHSGLFVLRASDEAFPRILEDAYERQCLLDKIDQYNLPREKTLKTLERGAVYSTGK